MKRERERKEERDGRDREAKCELAKFLFCLLFLMSSSFSSTRCLPPSSSSFCSNEPNKTQPKNDKGEKGMEAVAEEATIKIRRTEKDMDEEKIDR